LPRRHVQGPRGGSHRLPSPAASWAVQARQGGALGTDTSLTLAIIRLYTFYTRLHPRVGSDTGSWCMAKCKNPEKFGGFLRWNALGNRCSIP
jgi:hypothetical protein